jgi:TetR/AcrR family transcriptional regulator, cholesterol catabolism regulator
VFILQRNPEVRSATKNEGIRTYSKDTCLVESKRKEIAEKATRVFLRKGSHGANMREIAAECDMSIGSIYHYVGSKQDILFMIIEKAASRPDDLMEKLTESLSSTSATAVLKQFMDGYYRSIDADHANTLFTYQETRNLDKDFQKSIMDTAVLDIKACERILEKGIESGQFHIDNVPLIAHNIIVMGHMWAVRRWLLKNMCTLDEYILEQTNIILSRIQVKS